MKIKSIPKSGRDGSAVYVNGRFGKLVRKYVAPANPRTAQQQAHGNNVRAISGRWVALTCDRRATWRAAAAAGSLVAETGERFRLRGYYLFFVRLNARRADFGLPQFDPPPA